MTKIRALHFVAAVVVVGLLLTSAHAATARARPSKPPAQVQSWHAEGKKGLVVAGGSEAIDAGLSILQAGGNAFDAAAATLFALTVTDADNFCFGGEVPILFYDAKRNRSEVIVGQGAAPKLATREHFAARGGIPLSGIESAAVPGAVDAILIFLDRQGTMTFQRVVQPALSILDRHEQPWHGNLAKTIRELIEAEKVGGADRSRGLRLVSDYFYRGPIAHRIDQWSKANGGLIRYTDLATHTTRIDDPVIGNYRGYGIYKGGVWTQGPALLEALGVLDGFDLKSAGQNRPDTIHLCIESLKLAMADRDWYYADPLFEDVPLRQLLSHDYLTARRALIDPKQASLVERPGDPRNGKPLLDNPKLPTGTQATVKDTTTCLVADSMGNVVAATPSGWSGVVAGDTGVWLGSRLQSFNIWPGHPNCIEPGKRPRITLTPTIVMKDGKPIMAVSVAGGDGQDQVTLQMLVNMIDYDMQPADAVTAPRFLTHHFIGSFGQKPPELGSLYINPQVGQDVINDLKSRGHDVHVQEKFIWHPTAMRFDLETGLMRGAGDPKAGRHAGGY